jgi:hypothetical protein
MIEENGTDEAALSLLALRDSATSSENQEEVIHMEIEAAQHQSIHENGSSLQAPSNVHPEPSEGRGAFWETIHALKTRLEDESIPDARRYAVRCGFNALCNAWAIEYGPDLKSMIERLEEPASPDGHVN